MSPPDCGMNREVLLAPEFRWETRVSGETTIWYRGEEAAASLFTGYVHTTQQVTLSGLCDALSGMEGPFAVIARKGSVVCCAVDRIRSYPVFYVQDGGRFSVSNSARMLKEAWSLEEVDPLSVLEFRMAGYVTGRQTLFSRLFQVQAGEVVLWNAERRNLERDRYYLFFENKKQDMSMEKGIEALDAATRSVFQKTVDSLDGRPALIPLSGGLDSRLNACMLKALGYDRVLCYSYGLPGNWESAASREIASRLGFPWVFAPIDRRSYREMHGDQGMSDYYAYADGLCSLPFIQDRFALLQLASRGSIPDDGIVLNGNSGDFTTGGHIQAGLVSSEDHGWRGLSRSIVEKHFSLWRDLKTSENLLRLKEKIEGVIQGILRRLGISFEDACQASLYEAWEWQERQSKFVVNGQRVYDFMGYEWRLPHWDNAYLDFWRRIPVPLKAGQALYKAYLERMDLFGLFRRYRPKVYASPTWIHPVRLLGKALSYPLGRKAWHRLEKNVFAYPMDELQTYAPFSYLKVVATTRGFRSALSFRTEDYLNRLTDPLETIHP